MQRGKHKEKRNWIKPALRLIFILAVGILAWYVIASGFFRKVDNKCPDNIIPEKILILESQSDLYGRGYDERYVIKTDKWADGIQMIIPGNESNYSESLKPDCPKGSGEGQNSDYLYCKEIFYSPEDNTTQKYAVKLVLKPIPDEKGLQRYFLVNRLYGNYSIVNATCTKI
jgi:hypothetical protein